MKNTGGYKTFLGLIVIILLGIFVALLVQLNDEIPKELKEKKVVAQTEAVKDNHIRSGEVITEFGGAGEVRFGGFVSDNGML